MSQADPPCPKLPLDDAIKLAYSSYFQRFPDVLRASWIWLIVAGSLAAISSWQEWSWVAAAKPHLQLYDLRMQIPATLSALNHLSQFVLLLAGASVAVAWHRCLLLHERPGFSGRNIVTGYLWHYVLVAVVLVAVVLVPPYASFEAILDLAGARLNIHSSYIGLVFLLFFILFIPSTAVALRLTLLLPARAVGHSGLSFRQVWRRTSGNIWRLFGGLTMTILLPALVAEIVYAWTLAPTSADMHADSTVIRMTMISVAFSTFHLLILPISVGFLSLAYWHFFGSVNLPNERRAYDEGRDTVAPLPY